MADIWDQKKRSEVMAAVRPHGNKTTEIRLISILKKSGITGWRRKQKLPGSPDFLFRRERLAIFVDGCFWHSCPIHATFPKNRAEFWREKFTRNQERDRRVDLELQRRGWKVLRIWEHELVRKGEVQLLDRLRQALPKFTSTGQNRQQSEAPVSRSA